jgi:Sec-independent protein translocase protein TatA
MELFGIGPLELLFIFIIALVVLGPRDMVKVGRSLGGLLRKTVLSPTWVKMQREIRNLPYQMMREAGLQEEDLRIKADIEEAFRRTPADTSRLPIEGRKLEPTRIPPKQTNGPPPSVPSEWLGLPLRAVSPSDDKIISEEPPILEDWTSAPTTIVSDREPDQDKDS